MQLRWWNPISWMIVPILAIARGVRGMFPWSQDGRRTSLYLGMLFAAPVLSVFLLHTMNLSIANRLFVTFTNLAYAVAAALVIVVTAQAVGTGLNIFGKVGKDGAAFGAGSDDSAPKAAREVADAADQKASEIEEAAPPIAPDDPDYRSFEDTKP